MNGTRTLWVSSCQTLTIGKTITCNQRNFSRFLPASSKSGSDQLNSKLDPRSPAYDPSRTFLSKDVQRLLYRVTGLDVHRFSANAVRKTRMLKLPNLRFLTAEEWEVEKRRTELRAKRKLKMPPVMGPRTPAGTVISNDFQLAKLLEHKLVFTDVSYGLKEKDRTVVIREKDGSLRNATWDEKGRMSQTFFPEFGREIFLPRMFTAEFLPKSLRTVSAYFILTRACMQLEPDDPDYIRVCSDVYDYVDQTGAYDTLWSTRFFGGLVFYLASIGRLDGMLLDRLQRRRLEDAADIVKLACILHPTSPLAILKKEAFLENNSDLVRAYIESAAQIKNRLTKELEKVEDTLSPDFNPLVAIAQ